MKKRAVSRSGVWSMVFLSALAVLLPYQAHADIPPAPQPPQPIPVPPAPAPLPAPTVAPQGQQKYSVLLDDDLSAVILNATNFQTTIPIQINNGTGSCSAQEKSWGSGQQAITCRTTTSCSATVPACVMTFVASAGLSPDDLITILSTTQLGGISGPNS